MVWNFTLKSQKVAEKTAKNFRGLLVFAAPCRYASQQTSYVLNNKILWIIETNHKIQLEGVTKNS